MRSSIFILACLMLTVCTLHGFAIKPDSTRSIWEKGVDKVKLQKARHLYLTNNYNGALKVYRDIFSNSQGNAMINFRMGECHYHLKNYQSTVNFMEKASRIDRDVNKALHLIYAQSLHRLGEFDRALEQCSLFRKVMEEKSNKLKSLLKTDELLMEDLEALEGSIKFAKEQMDNPANVKIRNMGEEINSANPDYRPAISADGKTLIFTSRRPDSKGGLTSPHDHMYYEDIYISTYDEETKSWGMAEGIQGRLNTDEHDACLGISPKGDQIFVYKNIEGVTRSGDIYMSKLSSSGKWGTPRPLGKTINSTYYESAASLSRDGKLLYFISERKGGLGQGDIYVAKKISKREWGEPVPLGAGINTPGDENAIYIHPDEKFMIFSSNGHKTMGGYDIFISKNENGKWSVPVNLGYPINTVDDNVHFTLTADGMKAYYSTYDSEGVGETDIFEVDLSGYKLIPKD